MAAVADPLRPRSPDEPARGAAFALAAHAVLIGALSLGVSWRMSSPEGGSAELWSSVPTVAAPQEPAARAQPEPPQPAPPPPRRAEPPPREERLADLAEKPQPKRKPEPRREQPREEEPPKPKVDKRQPPKEVPKEAAKERAKAASKEDRQADRKPASAAPALQSNRDEALRRIMGQAGGQDAQTGAPRQGANAPGRGVSDSYAGRIVARVRPNIVFPPVLDGNPQAEVEVRAAADGQIISRRITRSSGVPAWDDAVLRALDRTEVLPLDENGRIPNPMILTFRPRDF